MGINTKGEKKIRHPQLRSRGAEAMLFPQRMMNVVGLSGNCIPFISRSKDRDILLSIVVLFAAVVGGLGVAVLPV